MAAKFGKGVIGGFVIVCVLLGLFAGANAAAGGTKIIKLGAIVPLTGPAATWGQWGLRMQENFEKWYNAKGGITVKGQKYTVKAVGVDDKFTLIGGRAAAEKFFYVDKGDFIVASFSVEAISGWAPLSTKEKKLAVIGAPSWHPRPEAPYVFRVVCSDGERSTALCSLMKDKFGAKSVLYMFTDDIMGKSDSETARKDEKKRGLEVKGYLLVPPNTQDFYPFLTKELKKKPDYIHSTLPPGSTALLVKQARELGFKGSIGCPTSMPGDLKKWQGIAGGVEASKGYIAGLATRDEWSPLGLGYYDLWRKSYPDQEVSDLAYTMQAHVLMLAIEKAQSFDPDDILKVLRTAEFHSFHKYPVKAGTGGEKTFGIKNHMTVPYCFSRITGENQTEYLGSYQEFTP
jgi:branched-chain amino acid transport system substrate-binding protein